MSFTSAEFSARLGEVPQKWRNVGPSRGGRVVAVAGDLHDYRRFWMGACSGGVWRTDDAGQYWKPVSDGYLTTASIGAIAVSESDSNVVWVGTGEACVRNNVVPGNGVYRTVDGGRTWDHLGLKNTKHIAKLRVHPANADIAFVAATGDIFGASADRGVYRTVDGGQNWDLVLHVSDKAGAADLVMDANNPRILFASIWEAFRQPWNMSSGGQDSGLWRSTDGGDTWEKISDNPGFAEGLLGRIGVVTSPAKAGRVWALVEVLGDGGGIYRSEDYGLTWDHVSRERSVQGRPWYYSHLTAHPTEQDTLWSMNQRAWRSRDGGRTFQQVHTPHGDNHDLWIDPQDPNRMINGNDGGATVSLNAGMTWTSIYNQPTAQLYRFDVDHRFPFDLYATQQDNSGICVPSRSWKGAIRWPDCRELGEAEAGDVALDRSNPRFVMLGGAGFGHPGPLLRFDQFTEQARDVAVWPEYSMGVGASDSPHRFGWTFPIEYSTHNPAVLYIGGERLFRSLNGGTDWESISPDLTRNDLNKQLPSGGPISGDSSGAEVYCTIHAFAESPLFENEFWVGTDDGLIQLSRDGGESWTDVTPPDLPEWATVARIEVSGHTPGVAYAAAHAYRLQDLRPFVYRTADFGQTWELISLNLPDDEWVRTVREDPVNASLIFIGTEKRVWFSIDRGDSWAPLAGNMPSVPIYDLKIRDHELIAGTHGRGFWILHDLAPFRESARIGTSETLALCAPPLVFRYPTPDGFDAPGEGSWMGGYPGVPLGGATFVRERQPNGQVETVWLDGGTNPPNGAQFIYFVPRHLEGAAGAELTLTILDSSGKFVHAFSSEVEAGHAVSAHELLSKHVGANAFVWDLRVNSARGVPNGDGKRMPIAPGPRVPPGEYTVELSNGVDIVTQQVTVTRDPRQEVTGAQLVAQYEFLIQIRDVLQAIADGVIRECLVREQLVALKTRSTAAAEFVHELDSIVHELDRVERILTNPDIKDHGDALKVAAGLDGKIKLMPETVVELADSAPTSAMYQVFESLAGQAAVALKDLDNVLDVRVPKLEQAMRESGDLPLVAVPARAVQREGER